ncbi:MAG: SdpI family protein [Candidatus Cloacimonetes bacterium]|nr:SdpI family protein [Candidatus Cloacimonadota bacterium]
MIKRYKVAIIIFLITVILGLVIGLPLPKDVEIPIHWNIEGKVDNTASKTQGLLMLPGIILLLLLFFMFFPRISTRYRKQEERFKSILPVFANIMVLMFGCMYLLSLVVAREASFDGTELLWVLLGIMFILLGNLFPKLPSSFFIGIRTPWTLSSEEVWRKTHRVGGYAFVTGGIFFILAGVVGNLFGIGRILFYVIMGLMVIYPILYSYIEYQKVLKSGGEEKEESVE